MRLLVNCSVLCALVAVNLLCRETDAGQDAEQKDSAITSDRNAKFFFKFLVKSTTTSFAVVRSTTTIPLICIKKASMPPVCSGRRKRRRRRTLTKLEEPGASGDNVFSLHPSIAEAANTDTSLNKEGRIITSWSTYHTTFTSISTVTTYATTASFSLRCTLGGINRLPMCGEGTTP